MIAKKRRPSAKATADALVKSAQRAEVLARRLRELGIEGHAAAVEAAAWSMTEAAIAITEKQVT
ncbi:hypothetical protein PQR05_29430 [Paraburkholderia sediminicola]|uniref:hypothetical protein n=1 Tax=Paraburkholderia sediminicola TaxID=458836 RepID=UPI0038BD111B